MTETTHQKGYFITIEGVEGAGKTTQTGLLIQWLESHGCLPLLTREPGGTELGRDIRRLLLSSQGPAPCAKAELLLYLADRCQHVWEAIDPALASGRLVLCDRYHDATLAYQGFGRQINRALIDQLAMPLQLTRPDCTVLLDMDPNRSLGRAIQRNEQAHAAHGLDEGRFEAEDLAFHQRVREGYLVLAQEDSSRFVRIDAARSVEEVAADIRQALGPRLEKFWKWS